MLMKRFLPLILSALATAALAGLVGWRQQVRIGGLRDTIASRTATPPVAAVDQGANATNPGDAPPAPATDLHSVLSRTKSRSVLRTAQELMTYYRTCPVEEIRALLESRNGGYRFTSMQGAGAFIIAMSALAERDLAAAVECVGKIKGETAIPASMILLNDWMLRDKNAALAWFHGLSDQRLKGMLLTAGTIFYGNSQPQLVEELRNGVRDEGMREKAASMAMKALSESDPEAALGKVNEIAEPDQRRDAEKTALLALGRKEPEKALNMMALNAAPDARKVHDRDAARVLTVFLTQNREGAARWISAQDPGVIARLFAADPGLARTAANGQ